MVDNNNKRGNVLTRMIKYDNNCVRSVNQFGNCCDTLIVVVVVAVAVVVEGDTSGNCPERRSRIAEGRESKLGKLFVMQFDWGSDKVDDDDKVEAPSDKIVVKIVSLTSIVVGFASLRSVQIGNDVVIKGVIDCGDNNEEDGAMDKKSRRAVKERWPKIRAESCCAGR